MSDPTGATEEPQRDALDWVMDRLVYGPYGALTELTLNPTEAAEGGRRRLEQQVRNARFLGEMTMTQGSRELKRRVSDLLGSRGGPTPATASSAGAPSAKPAGQAPTTPKGPRPDPIDHILEGYDDLSASQVVKLLDSLSIEELQTVSAYEIATRGRRTIATRAGQLIERG